ncbi:helix-turn-helix domain-containing protein [Marinobacter koreensis]|uniref:Helix-turn-helix domain-containing protein n=1 Tax=Marinobacter koreensis TaxID=335974 RepID=A0ABW0RM34_9GAMM|nr:AraC family transcriptional regulator [Marinobacter koreensis]MCK7547860.1 AraC family transcriptional regulator [Marinobacter koreensis]
MAADREQSRDIVTALTRAGAAPRRLLELNDGRALAHWHNERGEARYERPRHHALSIYTRGGEKTSRQVNGRAVSQGFPGAVCLFPAGSQSQWRIEGPFEFLHFYFTDQDLHRCIETTWDREPGSLALEERYQIQDEVIAKAGQLLDLTDWATADQPQAMDHLAHWLIVQLAGRYGTRSLPEPIVTGRFSKARQRALAERIEASLGQPLDLATMAGWTNLSPYHFARLFRASFGLAPYQYVQEQRLLRARRKLSESADKITVIALECGFGDASQFSRAFRKRFGVPPSRIRS